MNSPGNSSISFRAQQEAARAALLECITNNIPFSDGLPAAPGGSSAPSNLDGAEASVDGDLVLPPLSAVPMSGSELGKALGMARAAFGQGVEQLFAEILGPNSNFSRADKFRIFAGLDLVIDLPDPRAPELQQIPIELQRALLRGMDSHNIDISAACAAALAGTNSREILDLLIERLQSLDPIVVHIAVLAMDGTLDPRSREVLAQLSVKTESDWCCVRDVSVRALK